MSFRAEPRSGGVEESQSSRPRARYREGCDSGAAVAPQFTFRIVDGETDHERIVENFTLQARDSAGRLDIAADAAPAPARPTLPPPDIVRVSASTYVLVTPPYTNAVTLQRDTVFVLDAQTSADRAQQDSVWIGKLFPGKHPIVLLVTDLAWPHISGVRYWVGFGVPVVSHRASRDFLQQVDHKRTLEPDLLEKRRASLSLCRRLHPTWRSRELFRGLRSRSTGSRATSWIHS